MYLKTSDLMLKHPTWQHSDHWWDTFFTDALFWWIRASAEKILLKCNFAAEISSDHQRWADREIFHSESNPDPLKLNPIQSWSAKFLKTISPIQSWPANVKSRSFILPHEAKELLELFCLQPNTIGWRKNSHSSAFASWGKIGTAFCHVQNLTKKCFCYKT